MTCESRSSKRETRDGRPVGRRKTWWGTSRAPGAGSWTCSVLLRAQGSVLLAVIVCASQIASRRRNFARFTFAHLASTTAESRHPREASQWTADGEGREFAQMSICDLRFAKWLRQCVKRRESCMRLEFGVVKRWPRSQVLSGCGQPYLGTLHSNRANSPRYVVERNQLYSEQHRKGPGGICQWLIPKA